MRAARNHVRHERRRDLDEEVTAFVATRPVRVIPARVRRDRDGCARVITFAERDVLQVALWSFAVELLFGESARRGLAPSHERERLRS